MANTRTNSALHTPAAMARGGDGSAGGRAPHAMQCMEVWGGNVAAESGISVHGIDAWLSSQPFHGEPSGGDIHYVSMCGRGRIARFVLADVAGHGVEVNGLAIQLRSLMRKHITTPDQTRFARSLNRAFGRLSEGGIFATAALATYFAPTDQLIACLAGHPNPLWFHAATGEWSLLSHERSGSNASSGGLPLGIIHPTEYHQFAVTLAPGDVVILYTDGVVEQGGADGRSIDEPELLDLARGLNLADPAAIAPAFLGACDAALRREGNDRSDDASVLVLRHNGVKPPPVSMAHMLRMMVKMMGI